MSKSVKRVSKQVRVKNAMRANSQQTRINKMADVKMPQWLIVVLVIGAVYFLFMRPAAVVDPANNGGITPPLQPPISADGQCAQNPAYTYSAVNAFNLATTVAGTDYIKANTNAPVTSLASPAKNDNLRYWKSNTTYLCELKEVGPAQCGSQQVQTKCYKNATVTLAMIDTKSTPNVALTNGGGAKNVTMGANDILYLDLQYTGTSKESFLPFGGCIAVEYPTTVTSVTMSGALSSAKPCPHKWTYAASSTSNTFQLFEVPAGFDAEDIATRKVAAITMQSGSSNPSGTAKVTFQQANYYIGNDGNFYLGIEKDKNQDTTKVGSAKSFSIVIE